MSLAPYPRTASYPTPTDGRPSGPFAPPGPVGAPATSPDQVGYWAELGFDYQIAGTDAGALARGFEASLPRYR